MDEQMNAAAAGESGLGRFRRHMRRQLRSYRDELQLLGFVLVALLVFLLPLIVYTVPAGNVGVHWKRFGGGTDVDMVYAEGTRFILPWDLLIIYNSRLQAMDAQVNVLASDGLQIAVDVAWRFRLRADSAGEVHKYLGESYRETLIAPTVSARTRDVVATYKPEEIYTEKRVQIQNEILQSVRFDLRDRFKLEGKRGHEWFTIEDVLIKRITLPPGVQEAIVRKGEAFHQVEEFAFRIDREHKESERKRIEALGIRNFQEIVSNGMSEAYLRWRGIEATLELARSPNSKVIVIGSGKSGLPLILNPDSVPDGLRGAVPAAPPKVGADEKALQTPLATEQRRAEDQKIDTADKRERVRPRASAEGSRPETFPASAQEKAKPVTVEEKESWLATVGRWLGLSSAPRPGRP